MNLQPYKVTITNKTAEQLANIPTAVLAQDYSLVKNLFMPNFDIDSLTEVFMASPESFNQLLKYYQKLGIEVKYSVKQGRDFLINNQTHINKQGSPEFICSSIQYMVDNCDQDEIYSKISRGDKDITSVDQFILEQA